MVEWDDREEQVSPTDNVKENILAAKPDADEDLDLHDMPPPDYTDVQSSLLGNFSTIEGKWHLYELAITYSYQWIFSTALRSLEELETIGRRY